MHTGGTYVGLYKNHNEYEDGQEMGEVFIVSHCISENEIHYYEEEIIGNVIKYTATEMLEEGSYGFNPTLFGDAVLVEHTFVDGVGTITFDRNIVTIEDGAIADSYGSLRTLELPASVETIGFLDGGGIESLTLLPKVPPMVDEAFFVGNDNTVLYVPEESLNDYQNAIGWGKYSNILPI